MLIYLLADHCGHGGEERRVTRCEHCLSWCESDIVHA